MIRRLAFAVLVATMAATGLAPVRGVATPPAAGASAKPKVFLYGDSIAWEAREWFADMIRISGGAPRLRTFPASDLCGWIPQIRRDVRRTDAAAAVFEFGAVGLASCLDHAGEGPSPGVLAEYREDAARVTRILARFGLRGYWVSPPGPVGAFGPSWTYPVFTKAVADAAYDGAVVIDGGKQLRDKTTKRYTRRRPCLVFETPFHGCDARHRIVVRHPDGGHFCPEPDFFDCPVYSSGAWRFSKNMAKPAVRDLGLTLGLFRDVADARAAAARAAAGGTAPPSAGATGTPTRTQSPQPASAFTGSGVAVAPDGTLWQIDPFEHRLLHLAPDGTVLGEWWGFAGPFDVALDPSGLVLVDDGRRVVTVDPATEVTPPPFPSPRTTPEPQAGGRKIFLYGDSLTWEAKGHFSYIINSLGGNAVERTYPGTAICDWFPQMRRDVRSAGARMAVLAFAGVNRTPCVAGLTGQALEDKYRWDARRVIRRFARFGLHVVFVSAPRLVGEYGPHQLFDDFKRAVAKEGYAEASALDGGTLLRTRRSKYTMRKKCLPYEGPEAGCNARGRIRVRAADGFHFCPTVHPAFAPCPVWSGGSWRFAERLVQRPIARILS